MVTPSIGDVVLVPFPFSDLLQAKVRPAVCLAAAGRGDWILCQITSNPYGDPAAQDWLAENYYGHPRVDGMFLTDAAGKLPTAIPIYREQPVPLNPDVCAPNIWGF